jgi:hypothetical protein
MEVRGVTGALFAVSVLVVVAATGLGCTSQSAMNTGGGSGMTAAGAGGGSGGQAAGGTGGQNMNACKVRLDDPLNPCGPTVDEQAVRYQGTPFGLQSFCASSYVLFSELDADGSLRQCVYGRGGTLIAWERIESGLEVCDGRAGAAFGDAYSRGFLFSCLVVDSEEWNWIPSFDPGPTTISMRLATKTPSSSPTILIWLFFTLSGKEINAPELTLRYWYTSDSGSGTVQTASPDGWDGLGVADGGLTIVPVTPPRPGADSYVQLAHPPDLGIISTGAEYWVAIQIAKTDGSLYDQSNDYSYNGDAEGAPTTKVTAYVNGTLFYGTEP